MIRFFVSSTFRDMQAERDGIQRVVSPEISKYADRYYEDVQFEDYRWGIDTANLPEEQFMHKVIDSCLSEVKACMPYIIIMIGDVYGSTVSFDKIPQKFYSDFQGAMDSKEFVSLTELEILLGTKGFRDTNKCIFCMKTSDKKRGLKEGDEASNKLDELIKKVRNSKPEHIFEYSDLSEFNQKLTDEIKKTLEADFLASEYKFRVQKTIKDFEYFAEKTVAKEELYKRTTIEKALEYISDLKENILLITGDKGAGKSYLLCSLYHTLKDKADYETVIHFFHNKQYIQKPVDALITLIGCLQNVLLKEIDVDYECDDLIIDLKRKFIELLNEWYAKTGKKVVLFVDGLEKLNEIELTGLHSWIPKACGDKLCVVATCDDAHKPPYRTYDELCIENGLDKNALETFISIYEAKMHKDIPKIVEDAIINKCQDKNALFIKLVLMRLDMLREEDFFVLGTSDSREQSMADIISALPDSSLDLQMEIVKNLNDYFKIDGLMQALQFVAISVDGLREIDLLSLMHENGFSWTVYEINLIRNQMQDLFEEHMDGRIDFKYSDFRSSVLNIPETESLKATKNSFKNYILEKKNYTDSLYVKNIVNLYSNDDDYTGFFPFLMCLIEDYDSRTKKIDKAEVSERANWYAAFVVKDIWQMAMVSHGASMFAQLLEESKQYDLSSEQKIILCNNLLNILELIDHEINPYSDNKEKIKENANANRGLELCFNDIRRFCVNEQDDRFKHLVVVADISLANLLAKKGRFEEAFSLFKICVNKAENMYKAEKTYQLFLTYLVACDKYAMAKYVYSLHLQKRGKNTSGKHSLESYEIYKNTFVKAYQYYLDTGHKDLFQKTSHMAKMVAVLQRFYGIRNYTDIIQIKNYLNDYSKYFNDREPAPMYHYFNVLANVIDIDMCYRVNYKENWELLNSLEPYVAKLSDLWERVNVYVVILLIYERKILLWPYAVKNIKDLDDTLEEMLEHDIIRLIDYRKMIFESVSNDGWKQIYSELTNCIDKTYRVFGLIDKADQMKQLVDETFLV